ncbi:MAG TPA: hypothetical protein VE641_11845 [Chthoniobacterales bacterium]|nr:hypothetical protein [Chthoniobacterales bacterium]
MPTVAAAKAQADQAAVVRPVAVPQAAVVIPPAAQTEVIPQPLRVTP